VGQRLSPGMASVPRCGGELTEAGALTSAFGATVFDGSHAHAQEHTLRTGCAALLQSYQEVKGMEQKKPAKVAGRAIRLVDLADYQEGSVVSRTIIDKKSGTVTFFAFAEGQGLSEHTAPFDALVYLLEGKAEIAISGKPTHLKSGEMVIMPANQPHALKATENFKMILTMIRS
jgi:quercetin dioxygenase-like cupin family protein